VPGGSGWRGRGRRAGAPRWAKLPDEELLDRRLCDLGLRIEGSPLAPRLARLERDLERAGLRFRPSVWLSTDWFSPEGVPGFAIPFYLAHPRLARLERRQMLEVEGGERDACLRLLRHETGHALDHAYRLHRRVGWQAAFGKVGRSYPASYVPRPASRRFVVHLDAWYAQSHPSEDWAETFAVWLSGPRVWRARYAGWPALRKLEYVDALLRSLADEPPRVRSRERTDSLPSLRLTLRDYYRRKRAHYGAPDRSSDDRDLRRLFSDRPGRRRRSAAAFLRERRRELVRQVSTWTGQYRFVVDEALKHMVRRCRELRLFLAHSERETAEGAAVLLTMQALRIQRMRHREYLR
jgi:hypothetical protein